MGVAAHLSPLPKPGVCGRVKKPNRVFPQYIRFSYFLSLSLLVISKESTDKDYPLVCLADVNGLFLPSDWLTLQISISFLITSSLHSAIHVR